IAELYAIAIQNIRIEEARQNSELRYRAIYENTGIGMGILDKSGKLLDFNAIFAELFKFNSKSKNDIFLENLFDFGQKEEIKKLFGFLLSGRMKKIQTTSQMITAENTAFWGRVTIFNIVTSSISIDLSIIMIEDISDQRKAEILEKQHQLQLVQTHKLAALGEVVAGVAHEINNPNSFISFNIPILEELWRNFEPKLLEYSKTHPEWKVKGKIIDVWVENFHEIIKHIEIGSDRINKIVSSLKDYTRKEDSGFDKQVRIKEVIEKSMVIVGAQARRVVSSVKLNIDDDLPQMTGNPQKLEQVLTNLIMNSTNAVPEKSKGKLMITAKHCRHLNAVLIEIEDNGIGIAPENMDRVSEPFFTTRRDKGGTGLGLSVSYNIIKEHGGNLDIFSRTGIGTRMTVHLPVDNRKKLNIKPTILCVDDDEMVLKSLKSIFLRFENRFVEATSKPENVIEYLNEHPEIYLIISDV
ncbi:MAG: PAS domain S-box protein, partial [bacterium]|nr:PAS domain S-box protein [bacterium]